MIMKKIRKLTALLLAFSAMFTFVGTACLDSMLYNSESESSTQDAPSSEESITSEESSSEEPEEPKVLWSEWELITEPTCDTDGKKMHYDTENPTVTETAAIPARGHDYSGENNTCVRCGQAIKIPALADGQKFVRAETCTHTDTEIYEGQCDCVFQGRGEDYSRLQLSEGCYVVETVTTSEVTNTLWLSFSVTGAGQYMLYSIDNNNQVTAARYDASAHYITPVAYNATVKDGNFYSYVNCSEQYFNAEWRATYCLKAPAGTSVKICFVKVAEAAWTRKSVVVPTYPTEIKGQKAPDAPANTKSVEVDYDSEYYYSDPAFGGDGYYHLQGTDEIIFAAIDSTPSRLLLNGKFTSIHYEGSALNLQDGFTADGDYRIRSYVPFIMNCADDNDIFNTELAPDLTKNCYQNYCNADGMYPVNKELFKFLNLYVQSTKPIDEAITVEDWKNKEDWLWLSACYTYKALESGTEENPLSLVLGDNAVNIPLYDYVYCNLKADGVYTLKCDTENVVLRLGDNLAAKAPFEIAVETSVASPIEFTITMLNGQAATANVTVSKTVGVGNGLGENEAAPFAIEQLGDVTLKTVTVCGANDSISYYAYYAYTATRSGTITLTVTNGTATSIILGDKYTTNGTASIEVAAGDTVIIYVSNATEATVTATLAYSA